MNSISEAKLHLIDQLKHEQGFVGVGVSNIADAQALKVYLADDRSQLADRLNAMSTFEGFSLIVEPSGTVSAW
ncbi:hypothetical protein [Variovorax sp. PvP013]|uniref:hypothetical protein n=1 Tax=Variovorax sp. PvP013 TaxID=3156435 RepID=UPI003D2069E9